jgi:acyl dehydratase
MSTTWNTVNEGDTLSELIKEPGVSQLVKYSAGSGDFNPLHHDYNFPQAKEIGSIIVHGRFKYAALGQLVSDWLGHNGRVKKISCQYRGMDMPNQVMTCRGTITRKWEEDGEKMAELEIWVENADGKKTTPGSAVVIFD